MRPAAPQHIITRIALAGLLLFCLAVALVPVTAQEAAQPAVAVARPAPETLREDLRQILARREYKVSRDEAIRAWLSDLGRRLVHWWRNTFGQQAEAFREVAPVLYYTIVAVLVLLLLGLLYHIYITMRSAFGGQLTARSRAPAPERAELSRDPEVLLAEADRAAREGNLHEALRRLYLALIRRLDRLALVRYDRAHTNQEYLRQVQRHEQVKGPLSALTDIVDRVWYGRADFGQDDYQRCRELVMDAWQRGEQVETV